MINRINAARAARGLPPLVHNQQLAEAALGHARDMARNPGMVHIGSDGSDGGQRIRRAGYNWQQWGEVVGWGFNGDTDAMIEWWLNSPPHAPYILTEAMNEVGIGYVYAPDSQWKHYWVVNFGRRDSKPVYTSHVPVVLAGAGAVTIDLLPYLRGDGRAYMVQHPGGAQEKFRTVEQPARRWLQLKNSQWERFYHTDTDIWRDVDTSPGDGQYYRQFEDDREGARWCPRFMSVGQSWTAPVAHTVQTYDKATCRPVDHHRNGQATNALRLEARHAAMTWNGVTVDDVIELVTHTGEHMFFARGYGLVAWSSAWGSSAIAHLLPPNEADNEPEAGCFS